MASRIFALLKTTLQQALAEKAYLMSVYICTYVRSCHVYC